MIFDQTNPARVAAAHDSNPEIVALNLEAVSALERPSGLEPMGATLQSALGYDASAFVPYFIAMDTQNYQFWDLSADGEFLRYGKDGKVGALAMQASFEAVWTQALAAVERTNPLERSLAAASALRARIQAEGVAFIFADIPAAESRQALLLEVLEPTRLRAASEHILSRCRQGQLTWQDAQVLAQTFPQGYGDRYLKKAQLTLMFIAGQWNAQADASPVTLAVSAAADYQLPKVLRALGLISYCKALGDRVDSAGIIAEDGVYERAIRSATVRMCDLLAAHFRCTIAEVDFWLWLNRNSAKTAQFHLTKTTAY